MIQNANPSQPARPFVSVVVPVLNERPSLEALCQRMTVALAGAKYAFEIIFVDDGSTDGSSETIRGLARSDPRVRYVRLRANFGKSAALAAGIRVARGTVVATIDADLQERPEEIALLLEKLAEGYDVVSGWRVRRGDSRLRHGASALYNVVLGRLTGVTLHDFNCGFKCYRRAVFEEISVYGGRHRYLPVLAWARGFRVAEVAVAHGPRLHGRSRYGPGRIVDGAFGILAAAMAARFANNSGSFLATLALATLAAGIGMFVAPILILSPGPRWDAAIVTLAILFAACAVMIVVALAADLTSSSAPREPEYAIAETSDDLITPSAAQESRVQDGFSR